jgi:hypothetical protein
LLGYHQRGLASDQLLHQQRFQSIELTVVPVKNLAHVALCAKKRKTERDRAKLKESGHAKSENPSASRQAYLQQVLLLQQLNL